MRLSKIEGLKRYLNYFLISIWISCLWTNEKNRLRFNMHKLIRDTLITTTTKNSKFNYRLITMIFNFFQLIKVPNSRLYS